MSPELIAVIQALLAGTQAAQQGWTVLRPILEQNRDPTAEEWDALNRAADDAHAAVQGGVSG